MLSHRLFQKGESQKIRLSNYLRLPFNFVLIRYHALISWASILALTFLYGPILPSIPGALAENLKVFSWSLCEFLTFF